MRPSVNFPGGHAGSGAFDGSGMLLGRAGWGMSRELQLRIGSAVVLAVLAIGSTWVGGWVFIAVWNLLALLVVQEWMAITRTKPGFALWGTAGIVYAAGLYFSVLVLRIGAGEAVGATYGLVAILFLFAVVWASDICAYFAGRTFGGPKLAPRISPNKTWSGFAGGVLGGMVAGVLVLIVAGLGDRGTLPHAILSIVLSLASIAGDLFESAFKRRFGVKDSGRLIPGHGGFLDRLDGFVFAAIVAAVIGIWFGGTDDAARGLLLLGARAP
jgi:phosphatidate cytidylyltransferase